ncbi:MAG: hypothetical protein IPP98_15350 [Gemmatimonadetes bacterium]|nr:hypothetical protein [Gemmatimonadota bacterium]MBL0180470.1 hypothetical protein [Gemmatimonadota bacterium]
MYSTCLFCTKDLGTNEVIETLPIGRRLAFDASQGRLWVVCRHCAKWNLVPFESRLESIDACERLFRDTPTRYSTDNIGLARVKEGLELVRIGPAQRPEFAGWRYGDQFRRRRRRNLLIGVGGAALVGGAVLAPGLSGGMGALAAVFAYQWGDVAFAALRASRGRMAVVDPRNGVRQTLWRTAMTSARVAWRDSTPVLRVMPLLSRKLEWHGDDVPRIGQRVMAGVNLLDGGRKALAAATTILGDHHGDLSSWMMLRSKEPGFVDPRTGSSPVFAANRADYWQGYGEPMLIIGKLPEVERLAVEMYFAESAERNYLEGELTLLEREWRQAEQLAKIADGLALE